MSWPKPSAMFSASMAPFTRSIITSTGSAAEQDPFSGQTAHQYVPMAIFS